MIAKHNNKFLTFLLDQETYGIPILDVKEIIGMMEITHIPKMANHVKGVVNLRGKIIPIIDLRLKFDLNEREYDERTCIIVVEINKLTGNKLSGFIVDMVSEVLDILPDNIEQIPGYGIEGKSEFLRSLGKIKDKVVMVLDANKVLDEEDKTNLAMLELKEAGK
jgi:purine-binding chemotaxis protein CheW